MNIWLYAGRLSGMKARGFWINKSMALLLLGAVIGGATMAQSEPVKELPSLSPEDEVVVPSDPSLAESCLSTVRKMPASKDWTLGEPLLTRSEKWGLVWRADFTIAGEDFAPLVNRIVCWHASKSEGWDTQIAIAQAVPPLNPAPQKPTP